MKVRYEDFSIERAFAKKYFEEYSAALKRINGLSDIDGYIAEFESAFAAYIGRKRCIALNSGTDALHCALLTLGVGKGDYVATSNITYPAVGYAIRYTGATPVLVDVEKTDFNIDPNLLEAAVKRYRPKAVIVPHMFSCPSAVEVILSLKERYGFGLIEDVCQAESSEYKGKKLGVFGDMACFSFSYYKPLSSSGGGGGAVLFDDNEYAQMRNYLHIWSGSEKVCEPGRRIPPMYLMDAAAVICKLRFISQIVRSRVQIYEYYTNTLKGLPLGFLKEREGAFCVPQNFTILSPRAKEIMECLLQNGVYAMKPYRPMRLHAAFKDAPVIHNSNGDYYYENALHLPLYSFMKKEQAAYVCSVLWQFFDLEKNETPF